MRSSDADILIIPGWLNSGPDHWQTRWEAKLPTARRIVQDDWEKPELNAWISRIAEEVGRAERPVVLVAHSLGAVAAAHAGALIEEKAPGKVKGAFLVAPPAASAIVELPGVDPAFAGPPAHALPFPALLIASRDDPYAPFEESQRLGDAIGATVVDAGASGHITDESGHGPWPEGLMRFAGFLKTL
jgi:predicted alpha/beta hydrolase family esterase